MMKQDEAADPSDVGLLGPIAVVSGLNGLAHLIKQLGGRGHRWTDFLWWPWLSMVGGPYRTERRVELDWLAGTKLEYTH